MLVGPASDLPRHLGTRRHAAIHAKGAKRAEQRTVEQRPPARVKDACRAAGHGDQIPETNILVVRDAAVFAGAARYLWLHPEGSGLRFRMPERLAARPGAHQV